MTPRQTALEYLRRFAAADVQGLVPLLADDLELEGPHVRVRSRDGYLQALRRDPPERAAVSVLSVEESGTEVTVKYEYRKPGESLQIVQWFDCAGGLIRATRLDFDARRETPR